MNELVYFAIVVPAIIILGIVIYRELNKCPHAWIKVESGKIKCKTLHEIEYRDVGYYTIHECYHCKKLKKSEIKN
jgi:hypothetical protein